MDDFLIMIGAKIRQERKKLGYSQDALADKAGLHNTYIGGIERGEKNATVTSMKKIADALEMPLFQLLKIETEEPDAEDIIVIDEIGEFYRSQNAEAKKVIKRIVKVLGEEIG